MKLCDALEFKKDLFFEGAVQIDWFYSPLTSSKVAENFVFHGSKYFASEELNLGNRKLIDTISLVETLLSKLDDNSSNPLTLAIADYGTGKSHLAVTLAQLLSGNTYMPETFKKVVSNISAIDSDAANRISSKIKGRNFVMVLNGIRDFNLNSELLKSAKKSLKLYGLPEDSLHKLNRALETAEIFFKRNSNKLLSSFEVVAKKKGWFETGDTLLSKISDTLLTDDVAFEIVNEVYFEINGQEIHWEEGLSASAILEMLIKEYCGTNGMFDHIVLIFDEFGRYLEYTTTVSSSKSGESALQQIFELTQRTQNAEGYLHVINFIQRDIKAYLETMDTNNTKNIKKYIERYEQSDKYYISSNQETVFANLIQRKSNEIFENVIVSWQNANETKWKNIYDKLNRWSVTKGIWSDYKKYRKIVVEGIYPMHPISTFMLTNLSDYLQSRSSITLISDYIEKYSDYNIENTPLIILPEQLIASDFYTELYSAEDQGRQKTQHCIKYDNIFNKYRDKLSDASLKVLRANLILRILRFRFNDRTDVIDALSLCSGLTSNRVTDELHWLEDEYAVLSYDDHEAGFDFAEESNGAFEYRKIKKQLLVNTGINKSLISTELFRNLANINTNLTTNFDKNNKHKINTIEWQFIQELYPIEEFSLSKVKKYTQMWEQSVQSIAPKGRLIWLYVNKDAPSESIDNVIELISNFDSKPIVVMLLNDINNSVYNSLLEYDVLNKMDEKIKNKFERHYVEDFTKAEKNLKLSIDDLKKCRLQVTKDGVVELPSRMSAFLTDVFENIYPHALHFYFDGFITLQNNISPKYFSTYCSFIKILLSKSLSKTHMQNLSIEVRNRFDTLFKTVSFTSWKCVDEEYNLVTPRDENAKRAYELIENKLKETNSIKCDFIFQILCKPPYGMSEEAVTLLIAIFCATCTEFLAIRYKTQKSLESWIDDIVIEGKKIDIKALKESEIMLVDTDVIAEKFSNLFKSINNNQNIYKVSELYEKLDILKNSEIIPEQLKNECLLSEARLASGEKILNKWEKFIENLEKNVERTEENRNLSLGIECLMSIRSFNPSSIFVDNYLYDDSYHEIVLTLYNKLLKFFPNLIGYYLSCSMHCNSVEDISQFRSKTTAIEEKLRKLGFDKYAEEVKLKRNKELENKEEIRDRQELLLNCKNYIAQNEVSKYTTYVIAKNAYSTGKVLLDKIDKYKNSFERNIYLINEIKTRVYDFEKIKNEIYNEMTKIWEYLPKINSASSLREIIEMINKVLQRGIPPKDQEEFEEYLSDLEMIQKDIIEIQATTNSLQLFNTCSSNIINKYANSELDFNVQVLLENVISEVRNIILIKEENWKKSNLSLGNKSREEVLKWKDSIVQLPDYLSENTKKEIDELLKEANNIIRIGKIDDVIFYFKKLEKQEQIDCITKLKEFLE